MAPTRTAARLNLISRHLHHNPTSDLKVQFVTKRLTQTEGPVVSHPTQSQKRRLSTVARQGATKMSSQPPHPTLLIPGPIEFDDAVLHSMSHYR